MTLRDEEKIRDKLNFYKDRDESVHLKLKQPYMSVTKPFRNGKVIELKDNSVILDEEKLGEVLIYLNEITEVYKREVRR